MFPINPYHRDLKPTFIFFAKGAEVAKNAESETAPGKTEVKPKSSQAEEERELVDNAIKGLEKLAQAKPEFEKATPKAEKTTPAHKMPIFGRLLEAGIPILSWPTYATEYREYVEFQNKTKTMFSEYLEAMNKQYFNLEWQKQRLTEREFDKYSTLTGRFKNGMKKYLDNQLAYIFEQEVARDPEWLKQELNSLSDQLNERYTRYANEDEFINLTELEKLENESKKYVDIMREVNSGKSAEEIAGKEEYKEIFSRDNWVEATKIMTLQIVRDAMNNGSEAAFIEEVQKMTGKKEITDFDDAANEFEDIMEKRAKTGVKVTIEAVKDFNKAVNGGRVDILRLDNIRPESMHELVRYERKLLMGGITAPEEKENKDNYAVVEFMRAKREKREDILNDPARQNDLFKAIQNINKYYKKIYNKEYKKSLPKQLSSRDDPGNPKEHDKIARLLAMITLAEEAEWIIGNLDKSPAYKEKRLAEALADTEPDTVAPRDIIKKMKFRHVNKLHSTNYVSAASRGGFNGRDLAIGAGKVLIALTVFANLMQARKQKKLFTPDVIKNPILFGSVFAWLGIKKVEDGALGRKPEHSKLKSLAKKVGRRNLIKFINRKEEFAAMEHISENNSAKAIQRLLDNARKNARKKNLDKPELTKEMLASVISDDKILKQLPDKGNGRMRYMFYKKFMASRPNVRIDLRPNCESWA